MAQQLGELANNKRLAIYSLVHANSIKTRALVKYDNQIIDTFVLYPEGIWMVQYCYAI